MATKRVSEKNLVMSTGSPKVPVSRKRTTRSATPVEISSPTLSEPVEVAPVEVASQSAAAVVAAAVVVSGPSRDAIATLAYTYWLDRGCQGGRPEEDWIRAEQELRKSAATA